MHDRYHVNAEPPLSPAGTPPELLGPLAAALNALDAPVAGALDDLTCDMVELAFNSVTYKERQALLGRLGIRLAAPRRAGKSLCRDVRDRMRRAARQNGCSCPPRLLTARVFSDVERAAVGHHADAEPREDLAVDPVARWGATLVRLSVFAWCQANAVDARVLVWATAPGRLGPGPDFVGTETVRTTAAEIVEATPDFRTGATGPGADPARRDPAGGSEGESENENGTEGATTEDRAGDAAEDAAGKAAEESVDEAADGGGDALLAAHAGLSASFQAARRDARRLVELLDDGRPPAPDELPHLAALADEFTRVEEALAAAGHPAALRRLDDLTRAVGAYRAARDRDTAERRVLETLLAVTCREGGLSASALKTAQDRARVLLEAGNWEAAERAQLEGLQALVRLVELGTGPDADSRVVNALTQQVGTELPECVLAAVMHQELSLPPGVGAADVPGQRVGPDPAAAEAEPPGEPAADGTGEPAAPRDATEGAEGNAGASGGSPADPPVTPGVPVRRSAETPRPHGKTYGKTNGKAPVESGRVQDLPAAPTRTVPVDAPRAPAPPPTRPEPPLPPAVLSEHVPPEHVPPPAAASDSASDSASGSARGGEHDTAAASAESAFLRLVSEGRFGLAACLARAARRPEDESGALDVAAAAAVLRPGSGGGARAVGEAIQRWDDLSVHPGDGTELLLLPALVRTALVTGGHVAGAQLKALAPRLPEALSLVAMAVADRALNSALLTAPPMAVIADASASEAGVRESAERCRELLKPQRLRFNRATTIAKGWLAEDGMLGTMLLGIANGEPGAEATARATIERLSRLSEIHTEIDRRDRELLGSSGRPLQGSGRQDLVHVVERAVDSAQAWLNTSGALRRNQVADSDWAVREISAMRRGVLAQRDAALGELAAASGSPSALRTATARAARDSLTRLFHELEHGAAIQRPEPEDDVRQVIDAELLKIPLGPGERPSTADLLAAVDRSWDQALELQLEQDEFHTARCILDLHRRGTLPGASSLNRPEAWRTRLDESAVRRRAELTESHRERTAELRRAQADGALSDDQDVTLQELLADALPVAEDGTPREPAPVRRTLARVAELLPRYRKEAADRLRARLDALPDISPDERGQVLRHLETDGLATAADLVYFLELGEPVPEILAGESHLAGFFPEVPRGLPGGITTELVTTVRTRRSHPDLPVLDYTHLSEDEAAQAATALDGWRELAATEPKERLNVRRDLLLPALRLLGYEATKAPVRNDLPRSNEYRFVDVMDIGINGRAWAPAFGTKITEQGSRLCVLLLWGRPPAPLVLSRAAKEPSGESLLVLYFGTLGPDARAELARHSAGCAPLMVVDDAALAYLAARGNRQVSVATETLLPFSGVNPYVKEKRGRIGREMFYGRDAERKKILDPDGTQIIFGGRGLGKSALLNEAGDRFAEKQPGHHQPVYLNLDHHNIGKGQALGSETIWNVLDQELTDLGVLPPQPRRKARAAHPWNRVKSGIKQWLAADPRRRLLILMDECDLFFEADAPHCTETRRLKGLCVESPGRMKVVFAGLHSVHRFTRLARNGPFSHLAQTPTVVGPLRPQYAADLLALPMRALGFEFADVDLVNRVLGYCSYQPFLLQMFGSRLVEVMQRRRARGDVAGPPYAIGASEVEAVESDPTLRDGITAAFKETLTLDDRYNVIANVLARCARDNGLEARLSDVELREECASWWDAGFSGLDSEGFRAYLQEMVGLGVLAPNHDGRGWHLRGPNALRMIGTAQEIESQLLSAESECLLEETVVLAGRPELSGGGPAPLTVTQVNDLLGDRTNQTRVVLGTAATHVGDVEDTLRDVTREVAEWVLPPIGRIGVFRQEIGAGQPGERRVVISDLARHGVSGETCGESLELARHTVPERAGVTRAVVLVAGTGQLALWRELLTAPAGPASLAVVLRRHDWRGLKSWTQGGVFGTEERVTRLLEVTGGWPVLLDRARALYGTCGDQDQALRLLADELQDRAPASELVHATGLTADPLVAAGYRAVSEEFGDEWADDGDIRAAIELAGAGERDAVWVHACLEAFQVFERDGSKRKLEPVLLGCWSRGG
ncbi:hypothetical protein AB0O07_03460 [Streptomyces sp. NPDC093085]|uniref:hypothetical protein n=1 Tax=Streptomyces sp. NPDC093085 TaxID=3155068 RepID=UPI00341AE17A